MEFIDNRLCISGGELLAVMTKANYDKLNQRGKIERSRRACRGHSALVVVDSLPDKYRLKVKEVYPEGALMKLNEYFRRNYETDTRAREFFSRFRFENGQPLPACRIREYTTNASVILTVIKLRNNSSALRRATRGPKLVWEDMAAAVGFLKKEFGHTLPCSTLRFRKAVSRLSKEGYGSLISGRYRNQNSRKVDHRIERLLLSIDAMPQRPYGSTVAELYNSFVCGELEVFDPGTGELFDPETFTDKRGQPIELSEKTVANYLNSPLNKALRAKGHSSSYEFNNTYRPHHHRHAPSFSFSKISLDDRDLPRKMHDGKRLKAYYAYDVASGCVVGYAYNRDKNAELFLECVRNMFMTIERQGWNCPAQVEVEHHLVNEFRDGLMKAGTVFPFVRWCNPGNSQEKRAEHFNRSKKYGVEKLSQTGIGRWYARLESNRTSARKVSDKDNDNYHEKTYSAAQLREEDIASINRYNHSPHPNQKKYPGLTRWDVLTMYQNPDLAPVDKAVLYKFIGEKRRTTVRRNMYCSVNYRKYRLPDPGIITRMMSGNMTVEAYFVPDLDGSVEEIFIYQEDRFIARCEPLESYNEAQAEQTAGDTERYREQAAFVAGFDAMIKQGRIDPVEVVRKESCPEETIRTLGSMDDTEQNYGDDRGEPFEPDLNYGARGLDEL